MSSMSVRAGILAAALAWVVVTPSAHAGELRAGAARVSITPPAEAYPMASPSSPRDRPFVGIHDEIFVRALVLDDGATRVALVSVESVRIHNPAEMVKAVAEAASVKPANVLVFATHTHSNPLVFYHGDQPSPRQAEEVARTLTQAVAAVRAAVHALQPARIAFARGQGWVNVNNGEAKGRGTDPQGPSDKTLDVVRVETLDGKRLALIVNYASHAEVMFRSLTKPGGFEVSGDLPGAVSRVLEDNQIAPVVLYSAGAEADQASVFKSLQPERRGLPASDAGPAGWALLDAQARSLAGSVLDTLSSAPSAKSAVTIRAAAGAASCPGQRLRRDPATSVVIATAAPDVVIPLSLIAFDDFAVAGIGADLGSLIGQAVKNALPIPNTAVVTMTAGDVGYVLDDEAYKAAGHGAMGSVIKPGCAQTAIIKGLEALVRGGRTK